MVPAVAVDYSSGSLKWRIKSYQGLQSVPT